MSKSTVATMRPNSDNMEQLFFDELFDDVKN